MIRDFDWRSDTSYRVRRKTLLKVDMIIERRKHFYWLWRFTVKCWWYLTCLIKHDFYVWKHWRLSRLTAKVMKMMWACLGCRMLWTHLKYLNVVGGEFGGPANTNSRGVIFCVNDAFMCRAEVLMQSRLRNNVLGFGTSCCVFPFQFLAGYYPSCMHFIAVFHATFRKDWCI